MYLKKANAKPSFTSKELGKKDSFLPPDDESRDGSLSELELGEE